ncbi:hypothetical protein DPMN_081682 [Dreissena polymorpha]|uniref:Uncharacterized protein n=1 Tax=Dreissena polymorpha TaxID=45954 RepID=A0A9D3Y6R7_DREPO|nr:hypothetical protein DPMN_081682 [Dreissena polymorpha]
MYVASIVLTRKNAPPPDIIRMNLLTKFHEDRTINVASRVLTRKNAPPPGGHFHVDRTINVAFRVLTRKNVSGKILCPLVAMFLKHVFKLAKDIINKNLLNKFHDDRKINVFSTRKSDTASPDWNIVIPRAIFKKLKL